MSSFQVLHISDLHISTDKEFDSSVVLAPLIKRVGEDTKSGFKPEIVVVTGDIAYSGIKEEYDVARKFFGDLLSSLGLSNDRLFIVPGNHDVNRKKYRKSDVPAYENMKDLNDELENEDYRNDLLKGMNDYFDFVESNYPHLKSKHGKLIPFVYSYNADCGKRIGLVGLNSAWMCRKSPDNGQIAIGEYQVMKAMEELKGKGDHDLIINVFHHPLSWLWKTDKDICRKIFNETIVLSGHLHEAEGGYTHDLDGKIYQFQAGTTYDGSEYPNRYQYIAFDWDTNKIKLNFRKFMPGKRRWIVDSETGNGGKEDFDMTYSVEKVEDTIKTFEEDKVFEKYLQAALNEHRHLATQGFETKLRIPIELERVYINMHAHIHIQDFDLTLEGKGRMQERIREEKLSSLDIKAAFEASARHKIKDIVILGDPGSGKTTLLKYILIMLIQGKGLEKLGIGWKLIPFFAPLRYLKDPDKENFYDFIIKVCCLNDYSISGTSLKKLLQSGRGIILLDGFDEVADEKTRIQASKWIDKARKQLPDTKFIITSRFGGYLGKSRIEGNLFELSIQDFAMDEVKEFLVKWFEVVETTLHPGEDEGIWQKKGQEDALILVERIRESEHLKKLAVNPLILQIIALVHRDRGTLPHRRVELYEECTNLLLEKWDMAKGLDVLVTAREARRILQPLALWLHEVDQRKSAPLKEIRRVIEEPLDEIGKSDIDPEQILLNIRDRSGIFTGYSENEYGFTHLSFQEYLSAEQIRNEGLINALVEKYGNRWWREVTLLCLALDNPSVIDEYIEKLIPTEKFLKEIDLVIDAVNDSIKKPSQPFISAVKNAELYPEAGYNAVRVLREIGGNKAINALKETVQNENRQLGVLAFEALESLGAAEGVSKPVDEEIPQVLVNIIDNSEMVLVPAGSFLYGSRDDDKVASSDEKPQRVINLPAFYIDKYPVTNEQYCLFLNNEEHAEKSLDQWIDMDGEGCRIKNRKLISLTKWKNNYSVQKGYERHPVNYLSWHGADAYAEWSGKRLLTEQEWEKAARGTDGRIYPWGNEFDKNKCNISESEIRDITPVGDYPDGMSPYGCYDMAGNVWEWTDSDYARGKKKVIRGGLEGLGQDNARCADRDGDFPDVRYDVIGFRCARTFKK